MPVEVPIHNILSNAGDTNQRIESGSLQLYGVARYSTPVFSGADLHTYFGGGQGGYALVLDEKERLHQLETIVYTGSVFRVQRVIQNATNTILQVTNPDYPYDTGLHYIDARFVTLVANPETVPTAPKVTLPTVEEIIASMTALDGMPYIWGGNDPLGIPQMGEWYPMPEGVDQTSRDKWTLAGVDCSGLLYWATHGITPRNTSGLLNYGTGVNIAGKSAEQIADMLQSLDLIMRYEHVVIFIGNGMAIESVIRFDPNVDNHTTPNWVHIRPVIDIIEEHMAAFGALKPSNDPASVTSWKNTFVVRRWLPGSI